MDKQQLRAPGQWSWLSSTLATQRNNITKIILRLQDIGARAGTSLALHRKFLHLLEVISHDRTKELDILNDIEEVEKHHAELRQRKMLRQAANDDKPAPKAEPTAFVQPQEKPARSNLLKWFLLLAFFGQSPTNNKNQ